MSMEMASARWRLVREGSARNIWDTSKTLSKDMVSCSLYSCGLCAKNASLS